MTESEYGLGIRRLHGSPSSDHASYVSASMRLRIPRLYTVFFEGILEFLADLIVNPNQVE